MRYRGPERRGSTEEERDVYALRNGLPRAGENGRKQIRTIGWAALTAVAVAGALWLAGQTVSAGGFYWSLQARVPALEQRVGVVEKANREKLDRIIEILEAQEKVRKP